MNPVALIVEDETGSFARLKDDLERAGFHTATARDETEAIAMLSEHQPDVILLGWMRANSYTTEICRELRRYAGARELPVMLLAALDDALSPADKPEAHPHRCETSTSGTRNSRARAATPRRTANSVSTTVNFSDLTMDLLEHRVRRGDRKIPLAPTEFRLLRHFMENPRRVFSRAELREAVWGVEAAVDERTIDVHIARLRKAITGNNEPQLIRTVRAAGYALDETPAA